MNPGTGIENPTNTIKTQEGFAPPEVIGNLSENEINSLVKKLSEESLSSQDAEKLLTAWEDGTIQMPGLGNLIWLDDIYEPALGQDQVILSPDAGGDTKEICSGYRLLRENLTEALNNLNQIPEDNVLNKVVQLRQDLITGKYGLDDKIRTDLANLMVLQLIVHPQNTIKCVESIFNAENPESQHVGMIQKILPYLNIDLTGVDSNNPEQFVAAFKAALGGRSLEQVLQQLYLPPDVRIDVPDTPEGVQMLEAMEMLNELMASDEAGLYIYNPNHSLNYNFEFIRYEIVGGQDEVNGQETVETEVVTESVNNVEALPQPNPIPGANTDVLSPEKEVETLSRQEFRNKVSALISDYTAKNIAKMKSRFDFFMDDLMVHLYLNLVHKANPKLKVEPYGVATGVDKYTEIKSISDIFNCLQMFSLQDGVSTTPETFLMDVLLRSASDKGEPMGILDLFGHLGKYKEQKLEANYPGLLSDRNRGLFILKKLMDFSSSQNGQAYKSSKQREIQEYNKTPEGKKKPVQEKYYFFDDRSFAERLQIANQKSGKKAKEVVIGTSINTAKAFVSPLVAASFLSAGGKGFSEWLGKLYNYVQS